MKLKRFIVRKYVMARSAMEALRKEKSYKPDDVWLDEEYNKRNQETETKLGFRK